MTGLALEVETEQGSQPASLGDVTPASRPSSPAPLNKYHTTNHQTRQTQLEHIAEIASIQARRPFTKTAKATKDVQAKAKRLMREMQVFWKKNEKEERDLHKREQKDGNGLPQDRRGEARGSTTST